MGEGQRNMARVRRKIRVKTGDAGKPAAARPRLAPDWWLVGLSGFGVLLTAYLLGVHLLGGQTLFCAEGSSCDIVQESRWSTLLGLPMALWGMGLYGLMLLVALTGNSPATRWRRLFTLVTTGMLVSLYLTAVGWLSLEAFCSWCLLSLALMVSILVRVLWRRPSQTPARGWKHWLIVHAMVLVPALGVIAAVQAGWLSPPMDPRLESLALHLKDSDARFYGTFWCPTCQKQKRLFGRAAVDLPYVECSPGGRTGPIAFECTQQGIDSYPTWIIRGQRVTGVLEPDELARRARFHKWNAPTLADKTGQ